MAYSSFTNLKKVIDKFGIHVEKSIFIPEKELVLLQPSSWLITTLQKGNMMGFRSEKERSERLVHPILAELATLDTNQITIYSGHELNVDIKQGLNGECDYLLALGKKVIDFVATPLFSVVEAKKQDIEYGTAQCAAQIIGAIKYNELDNIRLPYLYGATTDGQKWRFLKFENNTLYINDDYYFLSNLPLLLSALQFVIDDCKKMTIK